MKLNEKEFTGLTVMWVVILVISALVMFFCMAPANADDENNVYTVARDTGGTPILYFGGGAVLGAEPQAIEMEFIASPEYVGGNGGFFTLGGNLAGTPQNLYKSISRADVARWGDPLVKTVSQVYNVSTGGIYGTPEWGFLYGVSYTYSKDYKTYFDPLYILSSNGKYSITGKDKHTLGLVAGITTGAPDWHIVAKYDTGLGKVTVGATFRVGG